MNGHIHHPPIETDPLGAIRKELLSAAWRQKARRDRNRRLATVTTSIALMLATVTAGAGAIGVDLPLIGDALDRIAAKRESADPPRDPGAALPGAPTDMAPGAESSSEPIELPWLDGQTATAAAYLNTRGQICMVLARPDGERDVVGCAQPAAIRDRVDKGVGNVQSVLIGPRTVVLGYVSRDVEGLDVAGPYGPADTGLGDVWRPRTQGAVAVRPFAGVFDAPVDGGSMSLETEARLNDLRRYRLEARLEDGRTIIVRP